MAEKKVEQDLAHMQMVQQNIQTVLLQKQQFQMQLNEIESALAELKETSQAYKIIGNIMIASPKESLEKDLKSKQETLSLRVKNLESQEEKLKSKIEDMQKTVAQELKDKK